MPRLERDEHGFHLLVDGRPFLILGLHFSMLDERLRGARAAGLRITRSTSL